MDIADSHMNSKAQAYWDNLVTGTTSQYKEAMIERLIGAHFKTPCRHLLDIGCGTCETVLKYRDMLNGETVSCMDYDPAIIAQMKAKLPDHDINWIVADIFELEQHSGRYDLIFLLDVIHEVYSFYGRPDRDINQPVDRALGLDVVKRALTQVASITNKSGGIVITDNVIVEEDVMLKVKLLSPRIVETVTYFLANYPTWKFNAVVDDDVLTINSRDFCILLTQYNKVKEQNFDRFKVERLEIHQYYTLKQYQETFGALGFDVHAIVGTAKPAYEEWCADFKILEGLPRIPEKRITLLAIKK